MKFWKVVFIFIKTLENGLNQLLAYVVAKLAEVWHIDFIENIVEKANRTFSAACESCFL